jgi:hypothetical protein
MLGPFHPPKCWYLCLNCGHPVFCCLIGLYITIFCRIRLSSICKKQYFHSELGYRMLLLRLKIFSSSIIWVLLGPQYLMIQWASTACYRDSLSFYLCLIWSFLVSLLQSSKMFKTWCVYIINVRVQNCNRYLYLYRPCKCNWSVRVHLAVLVKFLFERTGHLFKLIYFLYPMA